MSFDWVFSGLQCSVSVDGGPMKEQWETGDWFMGKAHECI